MIVDMKQKLLGIDLTALKDEAGKEVEVGLIVLRALGANLDTDRTMDGEQKVKIWELAVKIGSSDKPVDLTPEELVILKQRVGAAFGPMVVGPAYRILNGTPPLRLTPAAD